MLVRATTNSCEKVTVIKKDPIVVIRWWKLNIEILQTLTRQEHFQEHARRRENAARSSKETRKEERICSKNTPKNTQGIKVCSSNVCKDAVNLLSFLSCLLCQCPLSNILMHCVTGRQNCRLKKKRVHDPLSQRVPSVWSRTDFRSCIAQD